MEEFERLFEGNLIFLKRYVNYKISDRHDAEDLIRKVSLTAAVRFSSLRDHSAFNCGNEVNLSPKD